MSEFRDYYKKYHQAAEHILRKPTEKELAGLLPAFHPLRRQDGEPTTSKDYRKFAIRAWHAGQVSSIVRLAMLAVKSNRPNNKKPRVRVYLIKAPIGWAWQSLVEADTDHEASGWKLTRAAALNAGHIAASRQLFQGRKTDRLKDNSGVE